MGTAGKIAFLSLTAILLSALALGQESVCSYSANGIRLSWKRVANVAALQLPDSNGRARLPRKFEVYTADGARLRKYMMALNREKSRDHTILLPLAEPGGCIPFLVQPAGTMSPELAAKYPQLVSLKGNGTREKGALLRLDYNGSELSAEISRNGQVYLITPWKRKKQVYYLVYKKEDGTPGSRLAEP